MPLVVNHVGPLPPPRFPSTPHRAWRWALLMQASQTVNERAAAREARSAAVVRGLPAGPERWRGQAIRCRTRCCSSGGGEVTVSIMHRIAGRAGTSHQSTGDPSTLPSAGVRGALLPAPWITGAG